MAELKIPYVARLFVGGPWNNRVEFVCQDTPVWKVPVCPSLVAASPFVETTYRPEAPTFTTETYWMQQWIKIGHLSVWVFVWEKMSPAEISRILREVIG